MNVINILDLCIPAQDADYDELSNFADEVAELARYPIKAEPIRRGRWLTRDVRYIMNNWLVLILRCSECGMYTAIKSSYCPGCGARMETENE